MSQINFLMEPELIAATQVILPDINEDLILAKNYLKTQSTATGDSIYDHLVDLVHKIITTKPPDIADTFEQFSWAMKLEKLRPNFDHLNDIYLAPDQLLVVHRIDEMFRFLESNLVKPESYAEEEEELDLEEEVEKGQVEDLIDNNYYFREAGYGLPHPECYAVYMALQVLALKEPVAKVRFFGKLFGMRANYYVAETDLTNAELERRVREFDMKDMPGEGEEELEEKSPDEENKDEEQLGEGEGIVREKPLVPPTLPPMPESHWQEPPVIPVERPGQGINRKVYWVCQLPGDIWTCLPDVTPAQIRVSRLTVHVMTGDLDAEIQTYPPFEGTERNYLRAQIARIAAATSISPQGFYVFGSGEEEDVDPDMGEGMGDMDFNLNPFYQGHTLKDLCDPIQSYWVHHGKHILKQGRTIWWNPYAGMDEGNPEEEDEDIPAMTPETGPRLFSPLSEDAKIDQFSSWTPRMCAKLTPDRSLVVLRSNVWPGAAAYANNGKKSSCIYLGWGLKYQPPNFSPVQLPVPQEEYALGPEIMEMLDPTFADEEAYRIAHLPPVPPPKMTEEAFGEADEEDED